MNVKRGRLFFALPASMRASYLQNISDHFFKKINLFRFLKALFNDCLDREIKQALQQTIQSPLINQMMANQHLINGALSHWKLICLGSIIRLARPKVVVETGVAHGSSSAVILEALSENKSGELYSIDLPVFASQNGELKPWLEGYAFKAEDISTVRNLDQLGWLVPDHLRGRWKLILGDSLNELPTLLQRLPHVDVFLHDSLHTYEHMVKEFEIVWPILGPKGIILADDIFLKGHSAIYDFSDRVGEKFKNYFQMGAIRKRYRSSSQNPFRIPIQ